MKKIIKHSSTQIYEELDNTLDLDEAFNKFRSKPSQNEICGKYIKNICPHGMSGNRLHKGNTCDMKHPKRCNKFCRYGPYSKYGCNKGKNCQFFHPRICYDSLHHRICLNVDGCNFIHLKNTQRFQDNSPNYGHQKRDSYYKHGYRHQQRDSYYEHDYRHQKKR